MATQMHYNPESAIRAFDLYNQIVPLEQELEELKAEFRSNANGIGGEILMSGYGKITVSKPTQPTTKTVLEVDPEMFATLSPALQQKLKAQKVIIEKVVTSPYRKPSVKITPNV